MTQLNITQTPLELDDFRLTFTKYNSDFNLLLPQDFYSNPLSIKDTAELKFITSRDCRENISDLLLNWEEFGKENQYSIVGLGLDSDYKVEINTLATIVKRSSQVGDSIRIKAIEKVILLYLIDSKQAIFIDIAKEQHDFEYTLLRECLNLMAYFKELYDAIELD